MKYTVDTDGPWKRLEFELEPRVGHSRNAGLARSLIYERVIERYQFTVTRHDCPPGGCIEAPAKVEVGFRADMATDPTKNQLVKATCDVPLDFREEDIEVVIDRAQDYLTSRMAAAQEMFDMVKAVNRAVTPSARIHA